MPSAMAPPRTIISYVSVSSVVSVLVSVSVVEEPSSTEVAPAVVSAVDSRVRTPFSVESHSPPLRTDRTV